VTPAAKAIPFWSPAEVEAAIPATIDHLGAHRVLAYPTETVYGLGCAIDRSAVDALLALKKQPAGKPFESWAIFSVSDNNDREV